MGLVGGGGALAFVFGGHVFVGELRCERYECGLSVDLITLSEQLDIGLFGERYRHFCDVHGGT